MPYSEGEAVFFKKLRATLKYGLHWDAVISRWAHEHANEVGALDVTKKSDIHKYIAVFIYFSSNSLQFRRAPLLLTFNAHSLIR